jgi:hypothetical protein
VGFGIVIVVGYRHGELKLSATSLSLGADKITVIEESEIEILSSERKFSHSSVRSLDPFPTS